MATTSANSNPLITTKAPEAALSVQLHPLVLLTISDYITRHTSRQQSGPIIGAIIGQQNGRNFTLEHAYECKTITRDGGLILDPEWFEQRLEQYIDVHKAPALDLVGMFMLGPVEGPGMVHLQFVKQVQDLMSSDSEMLLLFHPEQVDELQGGKLPISLYESVKEQEQQGGAAAAGDAEIKFRELNFEVETGEAEMISIDAVATGAGTATAVPKAESAASASASAPASAAEAGSTKDKKSKGKGKAQDTPDTNGTTPTNSLSPEDEELIASLTAKVNAIKMLNQRLVLIRSYLESQPPSYLTDATSTTLPPETESTTNHTLLRSIKAMLSRLPLLAPPTNTTTSPTSPDAPPSTSKESQDVHLTTLLSSLTRSISEVQTLGSKFHIYTRDRAAKERDRFGAMGGGGGGGPRGGRLGFGEESTLLSGDGPGPASGF